MSFQIRLDSISEKPYFVNTFQIFLPHLCDDMTVPKIFCPGSLLFIPKLVRFIPRGFYISLSAYLLDFAAALSQFFDQAPWAMAVSAYSPERMR